MSINWKSVLRRFRVFKHINKTKTYKPIPFPMGGTGTTNSQRYLLKLRKKNKSLDDECTNLENNTCCSINQDFRLNIVHDQTRWKCNKDKTKMRIKDRDYKYSL